MPDPIEAMERFLARIEPYDPDPVTHIMSLEMRVGRSRGSFELTERAARAMAELLMRHVDPDDVGACANCGARLDRSMHCRACGHVDGIFGQTIGQHAADVRRREEPGS